MPRPNPPDLAALVDMARGVAGHSFPDAGTFTRPGAGEPVFDSGTGDYTNPDPFEVFAGPVRIGFIEGLRAQRPIEFAEIDIDEVRYVCAVPWDAPEIRENDTLTVTASIDPVMVGTVFRVTAVLLTTAQAQRDLLLAEV